MQEQEQQDEPFDDFGMGEVSFDWGHGEIYPDLDLEPEENWLPEGQILGGNAEVTQAT